MNEMIQKLSIFIFVAPLVAFLIMALLNRRLPRYGDWFATGVMGLCLAAALTIFWRALHSTAPIFVDLSFNWLPASAGRHLIGGMMVDKLTSIMLVVVTAISFLVHLFSIGYMEGDVRYGRYYCGLLLFTTSMLGLVLADNLLYLYIFWELVGLSSYVLIGHWFEKKSAADAAMKAFITTRLGDVGMFIGIMICYFQVGSLHYADLFAAVATGELAGNWHTIAGLGIFFGAMGKSAQFPLHVWLPDAMEGPTPVSALIHAATMVAAGVYLTGRMLPFFDTTTLLFIAYIGGFTAIFAATIALVQDDIKRVLAYSTLSQLGYMILALGVGGYTSGLFHLTTHAFFKAGLFLGSGAIIHAMHHEQSMSKYGGLGRKMPITATCYLLATLALTGFPGFSGFWSKDAILADVLAFSWQNGHWFLPVAGFATVMLTAFYMFRQYFLTFTGKPRGGHAYDHAHEVGWTMLVPLIVLGTLAVVGGGMGGWFGEMNPKQSGIEQVQAFTTVGYSSAYTSRALEGEELSVHAGASHETPVQHATAATEVEGHATEGHATGVGPAPSPVDSAEAAHGAESGGHHDIAHEAHVMAMKLSTTLAFLGIILAILVYFERKGRTLIRAASIVAICPPIHRLLWNKYYFDELYTAMLVIPTRLMGRFMAWFDLNTIDWVVNLCGKAGKFGGWLIEIVDRIVVDGLLVLGAARSSGRAGESLSYAQTGRVRQYFVFMVIGIVLMTLLGFLIF